MFMLGGAWPRIKGKVAITREQVDRATPLSAELQRAIGHSDIRTTKNVYGHLLPDSSSRVARALDAMIEAASDG